MLFTKIKLPLSEVSWLFFAQQRSGHHALIQWANQSKNFLHFNCCDFKNDAIYSNDTHGFYTEKKIASFEGKFPDQDWDLINVPKFLILRDPYNMYASRLKMKRNSLDFMVNNLKSWKNCLNPNEWILHAKEFLGQTSFLGNATKISYDAWFTSEKYRKKLAVLFDLVDSSLLSLVPHFGGGSSFDFQELNGNADKMAVLNRWEFYKDDIEFQSILNNEEIKYLWDLCKIDIDQEIECN